MDIKSKIALLKTSFLFANLAEKSLEEIAKIAYEEVIKEGSLLIEEGSVGDKVYFILSGLLQVYHLTESGKEVAIALREPGDSVGEIAIIDDQTRSANVRTIQKTHVLVITKKDFLLLLHSFPDIAINLLKVLSSRIRENVSFIELSQTSDLSKRTYHILQILSHHFPNNDVTLTHEELASLVGATRPRITEALNMLQKEDKIALASKQIHVK